MQHMNIELRAGVSHLASQPFNKIMAALIVTSTLHFCLLAVIFQSSWYQEPIYFCLKNVQILCLHNTLRKSSKSSWPSERNLFISASCLNSNRKLFILPQEDHPLPTLPIKTLQDFAYFNQVVSHSSKCKSSVSNLTSFDNPFPVSVQECMLYSDLFPIQSPTESRKPIQYIRSSLTNITGNWSMNSLRLHSAPLTINNKIMLVW